MNDVASMSNAAMWAGICGFFLPIAAAVIIQQQWNDTMKAITGFLCCIAAAFGTAWFSGIIDPNDVTRCFLVTWTLAIASYYGFWKPIGVAPRIESWTTLRKTQD